MKRQLQQLDDYAFEHFIADLWREQGWDCTVSQASNDAGIDVTATRTDPYPQKLLIQAKRYGPNTAVGGPEIQQYASLKHGDTEADSSVVVTSGQFTDAARARAEELNVKLVDGNSLVRIIEEESASDLLEQYSDESVTGSPRSTPNGGYAQVAESEEMDINEKVGGFLGRLIIHFVVAGVLTLTLGPFGVGIWFVALVYDIFINEGFRQYQGY